MDLSFAGLRTLLRSRLFRGWMIASAASVLIEQALRLIFSVRLGYVPQIFLNASIYYQYLGGSLITGAIILGLCQWHVIHWQFDRQRRKHDPWPVPLDDWQIALLVGSFLTLFFNLSIDWLLYGGLKLSLAVMPGSLLYKALYILDTGLGFGLAQWLFFKGRVYKAYYWIVATLASQALFELVSLAGGSFAVVSVSEGLSTTNGLSTPLIELLKMMMMILARGCLTGWVLVGFIDERTRRRFSPRHQHTLRK